MVLRWVFERAEGQAIVAKWSPSFESRRVDGERMERATLVSTQLDALSGAGTVLLQGGSVHKKENAPTKS